ncbi:MAG: glycosyltransferase, partial [Dictyoglomus sp.]
NSKGIYLMDPETGGCYDGINETGVNLNQGAESIISYLIAYLSMRELISLRQEAMIS